MHKVLFEFLAFKHPRLLLVFPSDTSTGGGLLGVKFLASENWCGRVHFGGHSPEWRVLAKFSVQPCISSRNTELSRSAIFRIHHILSLIQRTLVYLSFPVFNDRLFSTLMPGANHLYYRRYM